MSKGYENNVVSSQPIEIEGTEEQKKIVKEFQAKLTKLMTKERELKTELYDVGQQIKETQEKMKERFKEIFKD
tara:strand:- start:100 stop:318 length:219 start_codon:yes stop_codon:yes gene_type:complete